MARKAKAVLDRTVYKKGKADIEMRETLTPVYQSQEFIAPPTLNDAERKVWDWLVSIFRETINCPVSDADVHLMELYCRAKVAADEADAALKKDPRPYIIVELGKDKDGEPRTTAKVNPNIAKRKDNSMLCLRFFDQLGLTPLARARAGIQAANARKEDSIFAGLLDRED